MHFEGRRINTVLFIRSEPQIPIFVDMYFKVAHTPYVGVFVANIIVDRITYSTTTIRANCNSESMVRDKKRLPLS